MKYSCTLGLLALLISCAPPASTEDGLDQTPSRAGNTPTPECVVSRDCAAGERCVEDVCVAATETCLSDNDCALGERCDVSGECIEVPAGGCSSASDCQPGQLCEAGACKSEAYGPCQDDSQCVDGTGCLLATQAGDKFCGTLCQANSDCAFAEACMQNTVCAPNQCQNRGEACDAHETGDGQCVAMGQQNLCVKGASNCSAFGDGETCADGESCQPVSALGDAMFCGDVGASQVGGACSTGLLAGRPFAADDCPQGSACFAFQDGRTLCMPYCRVGNNADCPSVDGQTLVCRPFSEIDPQNMASSPWGACAPAQ